MNQKIHIRQADNVWHSHRQYIKIEVVRCRSSRSPRIDAYLSIAYLHAI